MTLRLHFSSNWQKSDSNCDWALIDESENILESGCSPLAKVPKSDNCIAIISADRVLCLSVQMPANSRKRWEAALPFIAEEYTLTDPEENHVVPGPIQKNGQRSLFIIDKVWIQAIITACNDAQIYLRRALPEMMLPNLPHDNWVIVWDGYQGFMRTGPGSGIALDRGYEEQAPAAFTLSLNLSGLPMPSKIQIRIPTVAHAIDMPRWSNFPSLPYFGKQWDWRTEPIPNDTPNLLWGALAPKPKLLEWLPKLRPLALILLGVILIETLGENIEWAILNHQKNDVTQEMKRTFLKTFGESNVVVNPPLQMQRNITDLHHTVGLPDDADFLSLLDQASMPLSKLPAQSISAIHFETGKLDVDLKLHNAAEFKTLQQSLQSKGLSVQLGELKIIGAGIETRVVIQSGGNL